MPAPEQLDDLGIGTAAGPGEERRLEAGAVDRLLAFPIPSVIIFFLDSSGLAIPLLIGRLVGQLLGAPEPDPPLIARRVDRLGTGLRHDPSRPFRLIIAFDEGDHDRAPLPQRILVDEPLIYRQPVIERVIEDIAHLDSGRRASDAEEGKTQEADNRHRTHARDGCDTGRRSDTQRSAHQATDHLAHDGSFRLGHRNMSHILLRGSRQEEDTTIFRIPAARSRSLTSCAAS